MKGSTLEARIEVESPPTQSGDPAPRGLRVIEDRNVYGVRVTVRSDIVSLPPGLSAALPPSTSGQTSTASAGYALRRNGAGREYALWFESYLLGCGAELAPLLSTLRAHVQAVVAARTTEFSFVHAGAVSYRGRGMILPGASGAGKSTLVRSLLRRGADYYSDEYAVLDAAAHLYPFACPIRIKAGETVRTDLAASYGVATGTGPVPVHVVVFPTFHPGRALTVEPLESGAAALRMVAHMPAISINPAACLQAVSVTAESARCFTLEHGASELAADMLIRVLEEGRNPNATL